MLNYLFSIILIINYNTKNDINDFEKNYDIIINNPNINQRITHNA